MRKWFLMLSVSPLRQTEAKKEVAPSAPNLSRGFTIHRNVHEKKPADQEVPHKEKKHKAHSENGDEFGGDDMGRNPWDENRNDEQPEVKSEVVIPDGVPQKKKDRAVVVVGDGNLKGAFLGEIIDRCLNQQKCKCVPPVERPRSSTSAMCSQSQLQNRCKGGPSAFKVGGS